jgi:hypothetical protein
MPSTDRPRKAEDFTYPSIVDTFSERSGRPKKKAYIGIDHVEFAKSEKEVDGEPMTLEKSILRVLNGPRDSVERLAFEVNPYIHNTHAGIYKPKRQLIPDSILKRIAIQDDLVAAIVNARAAQVAAFGRPRQDRYSTGFVIEPKAGVVDRLSPEQKHALDQRIEAAIRLLNSCGHTKGLGQRDRCSLNQWLQMATKNAVVVECLVHNFYQVTDVELDGYPVTPLDTMISAVTTHINITTHNKLYFQSGRASRGMLVIKSDDVDETVVGASSSSSTPRSTTSTTLGACRSSRRC